MALISNQEAFEVFDGSVLGDGCIQMNGYTNALFRIGLSGKPMNELVCYLSNMRGSLSEIVSISENYPKVLKGVSRGKCYDYCYLATRNSPLLTKEFLRWYPNGKKVVPNDVRLSPLSLAHFFMQDGQSCCNGPSVGVALNTQNFGIDSIAIIENKLHSLNLSSGRTTRSNIVNGSGIIITILQDSVNKFMDIVDPYVVEPYRYKIKHREHPPRKYYWGRGYKYL